MADLDELRRRAVSGDAHAAGVLGETYLHGNKGAEMDLEKAFLWSEKAAQSGEVRALTNLGILYRTLPKDVERARRAFEESAERGDMKAPRYLGLMYREGQIPADNADREAFQCFLRGAERNDITSQYYLGEMYERGIGTRKDMEAALKWYRKSAERGDKIAQPAMRALERLSGNGGGESV